MEEAFVPGEVGRREGEREREEINIICPFTSSRLPRANSSNLTRDLVGLRDIAVNGAFKN